MSDKQSGGLSPSTPYALSALVDYAEGSIVSRTLADTEQGTITLFAFDEGQSLSEHSTPYDAYVAILDGEAELVIAGKPVRPSAGEMVLMPAEVPHAVRAPGRFKMMLVMIRA